MIKFLLLIAVVFFVLWVMRQGRQGRGNDAGPRAEARRGAPPVQQEMIECPVCGVHLPRADALPGPDGQLYCCAEHRQRAGS